MADATHGNVAEVGMTHNAVSKNNHLVHGNKSLKISRDTSFLTLSMIELFLLSEEQIQFIIIRHSANFYDSWAAL